MTPETSSAVSRSSDGFAPIIGISPNCAWITGRSEAIYKLA